MVQSGMQSGNSVEPTERDRLRRMLEVTVFGIAVSINEYLTVGDLCKHYQEQHGKSLVEEVRQAGYKSVEEMLLKSGRFASSFINAKKHFKAESAAGSEATQGIVNQIKGQNKKKKKGPKTNTENREYLKRNVDRNRSFRKNKSIFGAGFASPGGDPPLLGAYHPQQPSNFDRNGFYYGSLRAPRAPTHGPPKNFFLPQCSKSSGNGRPVTPNQASTSQFGRSSPAPRDANKENKEPTVKDGVDLFLEALRACGGTATPDQLRDTYKKINGIEWGPDESFKYFGEFTTWNAITYYMSDLVEIVTEPGTDRRSYRLLEKAWREHFGMERRSPVRPVSSRAELYELLVNILVERYPDHVPVDSLPKIILERYAVKVPTNQQLRHLIPKFFVGSLEINKDGNITLNMKDPRLNDRVLRKSACEALESFEDSDSDDADSFCTASSSVRKTPTPIPASTKSVDDTNDTTVVVDQRSTVREIRNVEQNSSMLDRKLKITQNLHANSSLISRLDFAAEDHGDLAGVEVTSRNPLGNLRVTLSNDSSSSRERCSDSTFRSSSRESGRVSDTACSTSSSTLAQRLGGLKSKLAADVGRFFKDKNRGAEVEPPRNVDHRSQYQYECEPNGSSTSTRSYETAPMTRHAPRIPMNPLDRFDGPPKSEVECDHPYYNVHYTSISGDARTLAALRGLRVKDDSESSDI